MAEQRLHVCPDADCGRQWMAPVNDDRPRRCTCGERMEPTMLEPRIPTKAERKLLQDGPILAPCGQGYDRCSGFVEFDNGGDDFGVAISVGDVLPGLLYGFEVAVDALVATPCCRSPYTLAPGFGSMTCKDLVTDDRPWCYRCTALLKLGELK